MWVQIPREAFQAMDEGTSRADGLQKAAPFIEAATCVTVAGRKWSLLGFLASRVGTVGALIGLAALWVSPGTTTDSRWLIFSVGIFFLTDVFAAEALTKRLRRRAAIFAKKRPEFWR